MESWGWEPVVHWPPQHGGHSGHGLAAGGWCHAAVGAALQLPQPLRVVGKEGLQGVEEERKRKERNERKESRHVQPRSLAIFWREMEL